MCRWRLNLSNIEGNRRAKAVKFLSLSFVIVFFLHGFITVALSIWLEVSNVRECHFVTDGSYWSPVHIQLSSGCLTVVVCISSLVYTLVQRANSFVRIFSFLLALVLVLEISSAIVAGVMNMKLDSHLKQSMIYSLGSINRTDHAHDEVANCWSQLQTRYECCGLESSSDWEFLINTYAEHALKIVNSCGCHESTGCSDTEQGKYLYSSGCYTELRDRIRFVLTFVKFFGPSFAVFQMFAYLTLHFIFSKLYNQSVIAAYIPKGSLAQTENESCQVAYVS